ncbi:hypothetical protein LEN26_018176 [Aphanomyces euteiches]|nr:hypothetical protein LEN26_018176 [Aphanomyces euteiches]
MPCEVSSDGFTLDLSLFQYQDFLSFLEWTIQIKQPQVSTLNGYRSALKSLYRDQNVALPAEFDDDMHVVFSGIRKSLAQSLQSGDKSHSGKRPMSFSQFEMLCEKSIVLTDGGFTHLYLILSWNLMCRSKNTETVRFSHISFEDDCLGIVFHKTKTQQEGTKNKDPKHCYSNPFNPKICLFVALGLYLACNSQIESAFLFPGSNQKDRFGKSLAKLLLSELAQNGDSCENRKREIGTHSIRNGAATFVSSGITGGPSIVSVCLRCGWSLGNVMERYFRYEAAGDQFTGRVVAGLPVNNANFSVLPAHFDPVDNFFVDTMVQQMFPSLANLDHLNGVLRLVLASLVVHYDYLIAVLPSSHALLSTSLFCDINAKNQLEFRVQGGLESKFIRASGIPPHIEVYKQLLENARAIADVPREVIDGVRSIFDEHGDFAGNITRKFIEDTISNAIRELSPHVDNSTGSPMLDNISHVSPPYEIFHWGGGLHKLPQDFSFPSVDVLTVWKLWWRGNNAKKILPYRQIKSVDVSTRKQRNVLCGWKFIMDKLVNYYYQQTGSRLPRNPTENDILEAFEIARGLFDPIRG